MISTPSVIEDGLEARAEKGDHARWGWLVSGLVIGIGISVLALGIDAGPAAPSTTTASRPGVGPALGVADAIAGFPDGVIGAARGNGRSLELVVWPLLGELYERPIPVGVSSPPDPVAFDHSGRRLATVLPLPGESSGVLYAGVPESAAIVGVDVTGFAWHDSSANALSYTTFGDDELFLWVARDNAAPELVTQAVGIDGRMTAWGDWGFAVQDEARESIVLLTETGEIKDFHPGRVLASHESGWLVIEDDGLNLLSSGGGVRGLAGPETAEGLLGARFSPDRSLLAITTSDGLGVIAIDGGDELFRTDVRPGVVADVIWSSDGRFVAYPGVRGLVFVDVSTGETEEVLGSYTFTGIGVLPLSGA